MQLRYLKSVMPHTDGMNKVTAIAWSPNGNRLAVATADRIVHLFDENGDRKDKFSTKPNIQGQKNYSVRALEFSPDSTKLAVAQSDNIVFIYKLGLEWGEKKSICNKFPTSSSVTCLTWPAAHPNEIVFGLAEGKVKLGQLKSNKDKVLYTHPSASLVTALCSSPDGTAVLSAHVDNSIQRYFFDQDGGPAQAKFAYHSCVPSCLSWGESVVVAGNDGTVVFYDNNGGKLKTFDYSSQRENERKVKDFSVASMNPSGDAVVLGNFNAFFVYKYDQREKNWEEVTIREIPNFYTVTALAWKKDGSRLVVGNICGVVDLYDACVKRCKYKGKFEFTYVSPSQVIVKRLSTGARIVLKSQFGAEILKIDIYQDKFLNQDRYLVALSTHTLLVADLETGKLSEVEWSSSGKEKYVFDNESACIVYQAGELSLIEYGKNELLASVRTEHMSPHLISVRINERPPRNTGRGPVTPVGENKRIAYLMDLQTISIRDLYSQATTNISHDSKIDWLELNSGGNLLLFRDKRRQLHLFDVEGQSRSTLLSHCNYVQWVPESDVVVAQNRSTLSVWYNIMAPDKVTNYQIKGEVEGIERANGKTEVVVDEGVSTVAYQLDEGLINFTVAMDDGNFVKAMDILSNLELTAETEAMWHQLSQQAVLVDDMHIAERCAAALGNVARTRYLRKTNKIADKAAASLGLAGKDHFLVRARMAQLRKDFRAAEEILVGQGQIDDAIEMYQQLHMYDEAIAVAESKKSDQAQGMRESYLQYLLETGQEEKAGAVKEQEGDYTGAIDLFLKGGLPAKAARIINKYNVTSNPQLLEAVASSLEHAGMLEKAGEFFERMGQEKRALDTYIKGNAFRRAVDLARKAFPDQVVRLEESWGDHLVAQKQVDMAINHYIEANVHTKAIEAALNSRQWAKAGQLVEALDLEEAQPYLRRLARHYQEAAHYEEAEKCFVKAGFPQDAVEMYTRVNRWEAAHKVAVSYMSQNEINVLYISQAQRMEAEGKLKEAEKLYLTVNEHDLAIDMYKKARKYDHMVRLVSLYRKDLLKETHTHLAQQLEMEGNVKEAEHHYCEAGDWLAAVNMYRANDMWDEAIRVAKYHGGINASKRVAYAWALHLGGDAGGKLLTKLGLIEPAVDYAIESGAFEHAFQLAESALPKKLPEIHLKYALYLEDEEKFKEAEEEFIKAGRPKEAIDMYVHQKDWDSAMRVAEQHDPSSTSEVMTSQGRQALEKKDYPAAESLFISAGKPELILSAYQEASMWTEARRIAKRYLPHKLQEVNAAYEKSMASSAASSGDPTAAGKMWEENGQFSQAIDAYLKAAVPPGGDISQVQKAWLRAMQLAEEQVRSRYEEVGEAVAFKFKEAGIHDKAGDYFKEAELYDEAVDAYILAKQWEKARGVAASYAPNLKSRVEKAFEDSCVDSKNADGLAKGGKINAALDIYVQRGEWDKLFSLAAEESPDLVRQYCLQFLTKIVEGREIERIAQAVSALSQYGMSTAQTAYPTYARFIKMIVNRTKEEEDNGDPAGAIIADLHECLQKYSVSIHRASFDPETVKEVDQWILIVHFLHLKRRFEEKGILKLAARVAVGMLRYAGYIAQDKAYYLAGTACRKQEWLSAAFVYSNRYLDLSEAMEEGNANMLDNTDFMGTDVPAPTDVELPTMQYLPEDQREELRDWVLAISMDQKVSQSLPTDNCPACSAQVYEASLVCPECNNHAEACIVTGYPVKPSVKVSCPHCHVPANKDAWNQCALAFKQCPWCNENVSPAY